MSIADPPRKTMTTEEIFALGDDGIDRELIRGELRERPRTRRNRAHSGSEAKIAMLLGIWLDTRPSPRGAIHSGEAGFRLSRDPETTVGIDVAYASAELVAATDPKSAFYDGPPVLAVEILSPSDQYGDVLDKVDLYVEAGSVVWVVEPRTRSVSVYKPGRDVEHFNKSQDLSGEPELPGFRVRVAELFP